MIKLKGLHELNEWQSINCLDGDQVQLRPDIGSRESQTQLQLQVNSLSRGKVESVSLSVDQVDNLIQKLIDIRRQWPINGVSK